MAMNAKEFNVKRNYFTGNGSEKSDVLDETYQSQLTKSGLLLQQRSIILLHGVKAELAAFVSEALGPNYVFTGLPTMHSYARLIRDDTVIKLFRKLNSSGQKFISFNPDYNYEKRFFPDNINIFYDYDGVDVGRRRKISPKSYTHHLDFALRFKSQTNDMNPEAIANDIKVVTAMKKHKQIHDTMIGIGNNKKVLNQITRQDLHSGLHSKNFYTPIDMINCYAKMPGEYYEERMKNKSVYKSMILVDIIPNLSPAMVATLLYSTKVTHAHITGWLPNEACYNIDKFIADNHLYQITRIDKDGCAVSSTVGLLNSYEGGVFQVGDLNNRSVLYPPDYRMEFFDNDTKRVSESYFLVSKYVTLWLTTRYINFKENYYTWRIESCIRGYCQIEFDLVQLNVARPLPWVLMPAGLSDYVRFPKWTKLISNFTLLNKSEDQICDIIMNCETDLVIRSIWEKLISYDYTIISEVNIASKMQCISTGLTIGTHTVSEPVDRGTFCSADLIFNVCFYNTIMQRTIKPELDQFLNTFILESGFPVTLWRKICNAFMKMPKHIWKEFKAFFGFKDRFSIRHENSTLDSILNTFNANELSDVIAQRFREIGGIDSVYEYRRNNKVFGAAPNFDSETIVGFPGLVTRKLEKFKPLRKYLTCNSCGGYVSTAIVEALKGLISFEGKFTLCKEHHTGDQTDLLAKVLQNLTDDDLKYLDRLDGKPLDDFWISILSGLGSTDSNGIGAFHNVDCKFISKFHASALISCKIDFIKYDTGVDPQWRNNIVGGEVNVRTGSTDAWVSSQVNFFFDTYHVPKTIYHIDSSLYNNRSLLVDLVRRRYINFKPFLIWSSVDDCVYHAVIKMNNINGSEEHECEGFMKPSKINNFSKDEQVMVKVSRVFDPISLLPTCGKMSADSFLVCFECCYKHENTLRLTSRTAINAYMNDYGKETLFLDLTKKPENNHAYMIGTSDLTTEKCVFGIFQNHVYALQIKNVISGEKTELVDLLRIVEPPVVSVTRVKLDEFKNETYHEVGYEEPCVVLTKDSSSIMTSNYSHEAYDMPEEFKRFHYDAFKNYLKNAVSDEFHALNSEVYSMLNNREPITPNHMYLETGPAGCGKTQAIIQRILNFPDSYHIVSCATREAKNELLDKLGAKSGGVKVDRNKIIVQTSVNVIKSIINKKIDAQKFSINLHVDECFLHSFGNIIAMMAAGTFDGVYLYGDIKQIHSIPNHYYEGCNPFQTKYLDTLKYFNVVKNLKSYTVPDNMMQYLVKTNVYSSVNEGTATNGTITVYQSEVDAESLRACVDKENTTILTFSNDECERVLALCVEGFDRITTIHKAQGVRANNIIIVGGIPSGSEYIGHVVVALTRHRINLIMSDRFQKDLTAHLGAFPLPNMKIVGKVYEWSENLGFMYREVSVPILVNKESPTENATKALAEIALADNGRFCNKWEVVKPPIVEKKFFLSYDFDLKFSINSIPTISMVDLECMLIPLVQHGFNFDNMNIAELAHVREIDSKIDVAKFKTSSIIRQCVTVRNPAACFIPHNLCIKQSSSDPVFDLNAVLARCSIKGSGTKLLDAEVASIVELFFDVYVDRDKYDAIKGCDFFEFDSLISSKMMEKLNNNKQKYGPGLIDAQWHFKNGLSIVKDQMKFTSDFKGIATGKAGQTTIPSLPMVQAKQMFDASACTLFLDIVLKQKYQMITFAEDYYHYNDFVSKMVNADKNIILCTDFEMMDASRQYSIIQIVVSILVKLMYPIDSKMFLLESQIYVRIAGKNYSLSTAFANTAGHPFTLLWNIITTMVCTCLKYDMRYCKQGIFKGDDSALEMVKIKEYQHFRWIYNKIKFVTKTEIRKAYNGEIFEFCHMLSDGVGVYHNVLYRFCKITGNVFKDSTDLPLYNRVVQYQQSMLDMLGKDLTILNMKKMAYVTWIYYKQKKIDLCLSDLEQMCMFILIFCKTRADILIKHMNINPLGIVSKRNLFVNPDYISSQWHKSKLIGVALRHFN